MERIVVGVDGSDGAAAALHWAVEEAALRGAALVAVLVWSYLEQPALGEQAFRPDFDEHLARESLAAMVEKAVGTSPAAPIELLVVCDLPARGLLAAAEGADLLVVGARGLGGFRGLRLGSVSDQVVRHAPCPVVVIRVPED